MKKVCVVGNCHSTVISNMLRIMTKKTRVERFSIEQFNNQEVIQDQFDILFVQDHNQVNKQIIKHENHFTFPVLSFTAYHPDAHAVSFKTLGNSLVLSNIVLGCFLLKKDKDFCKSLFNENFISRLDYKKRFPVAKHMLVEHINANGFDGDFLFSKWHMNAPFMLNNAHPKLWVFSDMVIALMRKANIDYHNIDPVDFTINVGRNGFTFPSYNHHNSNVNLLTKQECWFKVKNRIYELDEYISFVYDALSKEFPKIEYQKNRIEDFRRALKEYSGLRSVERVAVNPYHSRPDACFWRRAISTPTVENVVPLFKEVSLIGEDTKFATAGSCFAQHIARSLTKMGMKNYMITENAPQNMSKDIADARGYGLFTARYGNIYTARQLVQTILRAYNNFTPIEDYWINKDNKFIDPYRPNIGEAHDTINGLIESREHHLGCVREMFENVDVMIFTIGLTESWMNLADGSVYPVAPGVLSSHTDEEYSQYSFVNFSKDEIVCDLVKFIEILRSLNVKARVLFTVSPVPLIATYEDEHVLTATTYSKSVLRTAVNEVVKAFNHVYYFPSYEIITGSYNRGAFFEDDLRSVNETGVSQAMSTFMKTMTSEGTDEDSTVLDIGIDKDMVNEFISNSNVVCDEELIEKN